MVNYSYKTLIISDSRGAGLLRALDEYSDIGTVKVEDHRGAGVEAAMVYSRQTLLDLKPDLVVVLAGICDITKKVRYTRVISLRLQDVGAVVDTVIAAMGRALTTLKRHAFNKTSVATITGVDLGRCNNKPVGQKGPLQDVLNASVIEINRKIIDLSKAQGIPTTWAASSVHAYQRGTHHYLYHKLHDRCHPKTTTVTYWACVIARVVRMTMK